MILETPADFHFHAVVMSHGWYMLSPFRYDESAGVLTRVQRLDEKTLVRIQIQSHEQGVKIMLEGVDSPSENQLKSIRQIVARCLNFDWKLDDFYALLRPDSRYDWVLQHQVGRILICPTVWEDLCKTLLTTNTTWSQTIAMSARLCQLGDAFKDEHVFPTPHQIAALPLDDFSGHVRAGYRAAYLHQLAQKIVSGELNVEAWYQNEMSSEALYKAIRALKGFGDYASGTMLRFLGRFDRIAIDTACRAAYKRVTGDEIATDASIRAYYESFGQWRGLVMWIDIMEKWFTEGF